MLMFKCSSELCALFTRCRVGKLTIDTLSKMRHFEPKFYGDLYKLKKIVEQF